ncbi:MAG: carotenoid oxygenase family protein, partial [Microcystaceae cyanobacterium]
PYDAVKFIEVQAGFVFHHANAFEKDDKIYLDSVCYGSLPQVEADRFYKEVNFDNLDPGQLWRFTIDPSALTVERELLISRSCEFPTLAGDRVGRPYRYVYIGATHQDTGNAPLQAVLKRDLETGQEWLHSFAPRGFIGEPIFVPNPDGNAEDDGWLLVLTYNAANHGSDLVILKAQDLQTQAIFPLPCHIPYGLHGFWTADCF